MVKKKVSVIILTLNEEENIGQCLNSLKGWSDDIHIIDSSSMDQTISIAKNYTSNIHCVDEGHWANIRNWALGNLPLKYEWVMFVDADEWLTEELKEEILQRINSNIIDDGFYIYRKFIFLNKWLKHGRMYPKVLRLFKREKTSYIESGDVEYAKVDGKVGLLENDMIHEDLKPFSTWIDKHNKISLRAAKQYNELKNKERRDSLFIDNKNETIEGGKTHWVRQNIWDNIPLLVRPVLIFLYVYIVKLGFLDGKEGLVYHLNHAFWYQLLIYIKLKEMKMRNDMVIE